MVAMARFLLYHSKKPQHPAGIPVFSLGKNLCPPIKIFNLFDKTRELFIKPICL